MIHICLIELWKNRIRKLTYQSAVVLNGTTALFISTRFPINPPLTTPFVASAADFKRLRFFNGKFRRYLALRGGRSPPFVLVFHKKNQNGGLKYEKSQFTGLLPVLSV
jgi:hypothetical protein